MRVSGVLGEQFQPFLGGGGVDAAMTGGQRVVDRQRAGLAGLVLDRGDNCAGSIDQLQLDQVGDGRSCWRLSAKTILPFVLECG